MRLEKTDHRVVWVRLDACVATGAGGELISQVAISDISGNKQAEETLRVWNQMLEHRVAERTVELRQSKEHFRQLTLATFEGIAITAGGIMIDSNDQLCAMFGYPSASRTWRRVSSTYCARNPSGARSC